MITRKLKGGFCRKLLSLTSSPIGFADVGSGGELKSPWDLIPRDRMNKFNFEATEKSGNGLPHCISNRRGKAKFFIAKDERSSSLHEPSLDFINRYGLENTAVERAIDVELVTLDEIFQGKYAEIDLLDFNVEGHDFQALEGAGTLLSQGFIKLIKIEFELTQVWLGQKWFSDIDNFLRERKFDLANIEIEYGKPVKVRGIVHKGEPVWGKAYYVPSVDYWRAHLTAAKNNKDDIVKAVVLYTLCDLPGRAVDILDLAQEVVKNVELDLQKLKDEIFATFRFAALDKASAELSRILSYPGKFFRNGKK